MKKERNWVIEVMDRKRLDNILVDWQPWWENAFVWSGGKQAEEQYEKAVEDKKTKRMERREKLAKKPYYNSLVGFSAFWTRLEKERKRCERDGKKNELARAKNETEEKLKVSKEENDRFWQGFLQKRKTHPSGSSVHTPLPGPDQTKTTLSGMADSVDKEHRNLTLMGVHAGAYKLENPDCTGFRNGGDCSHRRQVSTHTHPLEARDLDGNLIMD